MKKILLIGLVVFGLTGCLDKANAMLEGKAGASKKKETSQVLESEVTTLKLKNNDVELVVNTADNYETATIKYSIKNGNTGEEDVIRVTSASGVDLISKDKKIELFMKGEEGIFTVDGVDYDVKIEK